VPSEAEAEAFCFVNFDFGSEGRDAKGGDRREKERICKVSAALLFEEGMMN
jgi:hypothetical protein